MLLTGSKNRLGTRLQRVPGQTGERKEVKSRSKQRLKYDKKLALEGISSTSSYAIHSFHVFTLKHIYIENWCEHAVDEKVNPAYTRYQTTKNLTPAGSWFELSLEHVRTRVS